MLIRLTKDVMQKLLDMNKGFIKTTSYVGKNFEETNRYLIKDGKLLIQSIGKTSWADSRFDSETIANRLNQKVFEKFIDVLIVGI